MQWRWVIPGFGSVEIVIIAGLTLVLFGPRRMHEMLRALGRFSRQVQRSVQDIQNELDEATRIDDSDTTRR